MNLDDHVLQVGKVYENWAIHTNRVFLDYDNSSGFVLYIFQKNVSKKDLEAFSSTVMITFEEITDIGMFCFNFGGVFEFDASFSPNLYQNKPNFRKIETENFGYPLIIIVINSTNGELKHLRLIGMCNNMSQKIRSYCLASLCRNFNKDRYDIMLDMIYSKFSTAELMARPTACKCIIKS